MIITAVSGGAFTDGVTAVLGRILPIIAAVSVDVVESQSAMMEVVCSAQVGGHVIRVTLTKVIAAWR